MQHKCCNDKLAAIFVEPPVNIVYIFFIPVRRVKPTRCIVDIIVKAHRQGKKSDLEKRSYVYRSIWQVLKNQDKLPSGKVVYPPEIEAVIRAVFPAGIKGANVILF